jgi:hypothetical protein
MTEAYEMTDYRRMFDQTYLGSWDLVNAKGEHIDVTVTISKVEAGELPKTHGSKEERKKKDRRPLLSFQGKEKRMVCNKTNAKAIAGMFGNDTEKWIGKSITLYATVVSSPDGDVEAIRVRPVTK